MMGYANRKDMPHAVYRCFAADQHLLYVGCSMNPLLRAESHAIGQPWALAIASFTLEWFPDLATARAAETAAIEAEAPEWNFHKNSVRKRAIGRWHPEFKAADPTTWAVTPKNQGAA